MPTFLVTSKMHPALAARVLASVRGREVAPGGGGRRAVAWGRKALSLLRLAAIPVLLVLAGSVALRVLRQRQEVELERAQILANLRSRGAGLTDDDRRLVDRATAWLTAGAATYEGDFAAPDLRGPGALKAALAARSSVYVRGPTEALADPARLAEVASASYRDALLLCLVDPPSARTEKAMMAQVRAAYAGSAEVELRTASVRRLEVAVAGLAFLQPAWEAKVQAAEPDDLGNLRREIDRAPIERAKLAAKSSLLVFAVDEPGEGPGPTEIDGERPHAIRLEVVDLTRAKVLLRVKKRVDPAWISVDRRPEYASRLDSCAFAFDVLADVARSGP